MSEIEHGRRAGDVLERRGVLDARGFEISRFHRHGMNLLGAKRAMRKQAFAQVREVPVGMSRRRHPFVHLHDVHVGPGHLFVGQGAQHRPWRMTAADRHDEATTRGDGRPRLPRCECGGRSRHRIGIGQRIDPHDDLTVGFCQPPGGATLESTSLGPQVPGSYSYTGVLAFRTGSTMRHASST